MKTYLNVPFKDNQQAKALGARWDPQQKQWYAPNGEEALVQQWPAMSPLTEIIGEDRAFGGNLLFVDLIPKSCWFTNVRSAIEDWGSLRKLVYERANHQCECCQAKTPLEAHERWHYDDATKTQKLMRIIALCSACHETTHMGLASLKGHKERATQHLVKVTGMTNEQAQEHIKNAFTVWRERNRFQWHLNLSILTNSGIKLKKENNPQEREEIAKETLKTKREEEEETMSFVSEANLFKTSGKRPKKEASSVVSSLFTSPK